MKITILTVGKIKEKYLKDAINEYSKRLSKYCKLEIIEVADEKTVENIHSNFYYNNFFIFFQHFRRKFRLFVLFTQVFRPQKNVMVIFAEFLFQKKSKSARLPKQTGPFFS